MNLILFDDPIFRIHLLPFTYTRPISKIRVGILTIDEKWEKWLDTKASFQTAEYLSNKFPRRKNGDDLLVNGAVCPDQKLVDTIKALPANYFLIQNQLLVAAKAPVSEISPSNSIQYDGPLTVIDRPWKIFRENAAQIKVDFPLITRGRSSAGIQDRH